MLAAFQQAMADLVASPPMCEDLRRSRSALRDYDLNDLEADRLAAMVALPAMAANCMVYRSNRLTPIAVNFPRTCTTLGTDLRIIVDRFWSCCPTQPFVHFLIEARRFAEFLAGLLDADDLPPTVDRGALVAVLARESERVNIQFAATTAA
ncbi:MAG TPA: hypothetical protein VHQ23_07395 [Ilumatobacteraceae bacterium]|jgi:hypothetical protein|nr:hypothetical protein [Ilumatobacteraceae bacterium]